MGATNIFHSKPDSASVSPVYSYETSYLGATPPNPGSYAVIYQNFTAESYPTVVVISFSVRDSCTSDSEEGYYAKQALLNDRVIWEDDVAGDDNWQHVKVPVALTAATNKLYLI